MTNTLTKLSCALVFAVVAVPAHATEVLSNGNFSAGLTGWTAYTTTNGTISASPSTPTGAQPQIASTVSFNVNGSGASNALFLNAGKINGPYNAAPGEGGGVFQTFTSAGGVATFSADVAAFYSRTSGALGLGVVSVLIDGVALTSYNFGDVSAGPVTLRNTLGFTTNLSAGNHTISLQATRLFAPALGVTSQYFDNVSLDVAAVPEPATWAMMIAGFGVIGGSLRQRRRAGVAIA